MALLAALEHRPTITTPSDREIRIERGFAAPRDQLWKALTQADLLSQWWGRGNPVTVERIEPQRGGRWRFVEQSDAGPQGFEGRFREVEPPVRLVETFEWDGMPGHVAIQSMSLEQLGDGKTTLVTVMTFHTTEERDGMLAAGMEDGLGKSYRALDDVLARLGP